MCDSKNGSRRTSRFAVTAVSKPNPTAVGFGFLETMDFARDEDQLAATGVTDPITNRNWPHQLAGIVYGSSSEGHPSQYCVLYRNG